MGKGKEILEGTKKTYEGGKKLFSFVGNLFKGGEEAAQETKKLVQRNSANKKLNQMLQKASEQPSEEQIFRQQHNSRTMARIRKNAGGDKELENKFKAKYKEAEEKYGKQFENDLINNVDFTPEGARRFANDKKLEFFENYLRDNKRIPVNLTETEARSINKAVENSFKAQKKNTVQHVEELAERYNRMYPAFSPVGAAYIAGGVGGAGLLGGTIYHALASGTPEEQQQESESKYRWTPNGWEQNVDDKWIPQTSGYGVDRFGNTNFYDEQSGTWLKPGEYYQGSNGLVYTSDGSRQIGYNDAATAAQNAGMGTDLFGYYAKSHNISPDDINTIKAIQQKLGVSADGIWGQQTENAYNKAVADNPSYFTVAQ